MRVSASELCQIGTLEKESRKLKDTSKLINELVDEVVLNYSGPFDAYIQEILETKLKNSYHLTNAEIEEMTLRIPVYLYLIATGLENLGVDGDMAKLQRQEIHNQAYLDIEGTIQDKTKYAELKSNKEQVLEIVYQRAYKKLKFKLDAAYAVHASIRKILTKRITELELSKSDKSYVGGY